MNGQRPTTDEDALQIIVFRYKVNTRLCNKNSAVGTTTRMLIVTRYKPDYKKSTVTDKRINHMKVLAVNTVTQQCHKTIILSVKDFHYMHTSYTSHSRQVAPSYSANPLCKFTVGTRFLTNVYAAVLFRHPVI